MTSSLAMQSVVQAMLCGDEVKAVVVDMGANTSRFGFGGQESPRHAFRSDIGLVAGDESSMDVEGSSDKGKQAVRRSDGKRAVLGDLSLRFIRDDISVEKPFVVNQGKDGATINWDHVESIMQYGYTQSMHIDPREYCGLFADNYFESDSDKAALFELCFEKFEQPAAYIMSNASLASFSAGRQTSLVVDFGATQTRVTPVVDGFVINGGVLRTNRGGDWFDEIITDIVNDTSKSPGSGSSSSSSGGGGGGGGGKKRKAGPSSLRRDPIIIKQWFEKDADAVKRYGKCAPSLREMHVRDVIRDLKKWMTFVPYQKVPDDVRDNFINNVIKLPDYELPDGSMVTYFDELCTGPEKLFIPADGKVPKQAPRPVVGLPAHSQVAGIDVNTDSLQEIVRASVLGCDVDCRKEIMSNVMLVGGGSLIDGMQQRLTDELKAVFPDNIKVKTSVQLPLERTNAAWTGGSILSICGSFQQMWISKQEWLEEGERLLSHRLK
jgi:actin-related protein